MVAALRGAARLEVLDDHPRADIAQGRKDDAGPVAVPVLGLDRHRTKRPRSMSAFVPPGLGTLARFGPPGPSRQPPLDRVQSAAPAQYRAVAIRDLEAHEQMGRQHALQPRRRPRVARNGYTARAVEEPGQRLVQRAVPEPRPGDEFPSCAGQRHHRPAHALGQGTQERERLLPEHPRHEPLEPAGVEVHQHVERNRQRQSVVVLAGREPVGESERLVADPQRVGIIRLARGRHAGRDVLAAENQRANRVLVEPREPLLESPPVHDVRRDPGIVEREYRIVAHHRARAAELVLHDAKPLELPGIALHEGMCTVVSALDQPGADEDLPRTLPAHRREPHPTAGHERQSVERDLLEHHRLGAACIPVRVEVGAAHEIARRLLHPLGADPAGHERVRAFGLHDLGGDDPGRDGRVEHRARGQPKSGPAKTRVPPLRRAGADAAKQPREERPVNPSRRGSELAGPDSELAADVEDLAVHVQPVTHPGRREGVPPAEPAHRLARILRDRPEAAPEVYDSKEIRARIGEAALGGLGRGLAPRAPFAGIGHAQEARDDQHVGDAAERVRFEQHAPDSRVQRQPRQPAPDLRQLAVGVRSPPARAGAAGRR